MAESKFVDLDNLRTILEAEVHPWVLAGVPILGRDVSATETLVNIMV